MEILVQTCIWTCHLVNIGIHFVAGSLPGDALGTMLEGEPPKNNKQQILKSFWEARFDKVLCVFTKSAFSTFSEPLFCHIPGPRDAQEV